MKKTILTIAIALLSFGIKAQGSLCFNQATYATGGYPESVTSADFNGDGKPDMAIANSNDNNVSVLLNNGAGMFSAAVTYSVGVNPNSITSADFNGDGKLDMAVVNQSDNNVSILLNVGAGTFSAAVNYGAGNVPLSITSADFNGDSKSDMAVVNGADKTVSVFLNAGAGTFSAAVTYSVGVNPNSITSADFNGDGKLDMAVTNQIDNNVSVLLNAGAGTFSAAVTYGVGTYPNSVTSADFNGDGKPDMATANNGSSNVSVLLNAGAGTFSAAVTYGVGNNPGSVTSADFNGDGRPDMATANQTNNNVSVLLNTGAGKFSAAVTYTVGNNPRSVTSADFNGDGKPDMATANYNDNNASVLINCTVFLGAALNFDGVNDNVQLPRSVSNDFTIEYWMRTTQTAGGGSQWYNGNGVVDAEAPGGVNDFGTALVGSNLAFGIGNPDITIFSASSVNTGSWVHVAATWQQSTGAMNLYINGTLESSGTSSGTAPRTDAPNIYMGTNNDLTTYYGGDIDEVRIWSRVLCVTEIQNSMNAELKLPQNGLAAYYRLNQGIARISNSTVTTAIDSSGNSNTGTLQNFALTGDSSNWISTDAVTIGSYAPTFVSPVISVTSYTNAICMGTSATFTAVGDAGNTYVWDANANSATTNTVVVSPTGTASVVYSVVGTNSVGCVSNPATTTLSINALPTITVNSGSVCVGNSYTISPGGATTYTYSSGSAVVTATAAVTDYTVTGTDGNGCVNTATVEVDAKTCSSAGIDGLTNTMQVTVYPNPNNGSFSIATTNISENSTLVIYNSIGQLVYTQRLSKAVETINTNLDNGMYTIKLQNTQGISTQHIIIAQ
jgi:ankyrin repeat protein